MLKNYFKIAWRNLWKQKGYSLINIFGLAIGLASCIVILLYITNELSYDKFNEKSDRIYRVATTIDFSGNHLDMAYTPTLMGPTLVSDFPEVETTARLITWGSMLIRKDDTNLKEYGGVFADPEVFEVFTLPMISGDPETALEDPNTIVLTKTMAKKYFDKADVVGESMLLNDNDVYTITGVIEDIPSNSHFQFDFFMSLKNHPSLENTTWFSNNFRTYVLFREGVDADAFAENFEIMKTKYLEPMLISHMGVNFEQFEAAGNQLEYTLQPLTSIHLNSDLNGEFEANSSMTYVYVFAGLALFILLLACINFMNLSTARSAQRAKEVGIRKTLGSLKSQLSFQFLAESIMLSLIAFVLGLLLVEISLPYFSEISGTALNNNYFAQPEVFSGVTLIVILTGLLSGTYPALLLSSFKPVAVLKGSFSEAKRHNILRKGLVVFQFTISMVIIVGLLVVNRQLDFIQTTNIGFQKDQVLILNGAFALGDADQVQTFKDETMKNSIFRNATVSGFFPVDGYNRSDTVFWPEDKDPNEDNTSSMQVWDIDDNYIPTLGMELVAGRNFSKELAGDKNAVILNEAAVKKMGIIDPVGKVIKGFGDESPDPEFYESFTIIGVVKDFHYESLRQNITSLGFFYGKSQQNIAYQIDPENASAALEYLQKTWKEFAPTQPFSYAFMNERFDQMYRAENRVQNLMSVFSLLATIIACLGLFGLSAFSAERRTKEIGLRKVLGASVRSVLGLMSKEFIELILISYVIAIPVAWFAMNEWLQGFTYRTNVGFTVFAIAGMGMLLIALITVSGQSIKAALMNPVDSLRNE